MDRSGKPATGQQHLEVNLTNSHALSGFRPSTTRTAGHVQDYIDLVIEKNAQLGEHYVSRMIGEAVVELDRLQGDV